MIENVIDVNRILEVKEFLSQINSLDLEKVMFIKNGKVIHVDPNSIKEFELMGLSNVDFIMTGMYQRKAE